METNDIGEGTRIWHFAHVRDGAKIGKGCNIGKSVYVDTGGAVIGTTSRSRISSRSTKASSLGMMYS